MIYQNLTNMAEYAYFAKCDECGKTLRTCCNVKDGLIEIINESKWSIDVDERVVCPRCQERMKNDEAQRKSDTDSVRAMV